MYDSRIGRRWERDPVVDHSISPYATFANNPIMYADPLGLSVADRIKMIWNSAKEIYEEDKAARTDEFGPDVDLTSYNGGARDGQFEVRSSRGLWIYGDKSGIIATPKRNGQALGDYFRFMAKLSPVGSIAKATTFDNLNSVYTTHNWIVNRQTYDIEGNNIGRMAAEKNAVLTVGSTMFGAVGNEINAIRNSVTFPEIKDLSSKISNKQLRHIQSRNEYRGGGTMATKADAQKVLDAIINKTAEYLGTTKSGNHVFRVKGVTGTNINAAKDISQPTNVFMLKGTIAPSIIPYNPNGL